jgi:hypothetical protein
MQQAAQKQDIFTSWILWHFFETPKFLFEVWNNYFNYAANFFSFALLLKTFFSPWRRFVWSYPRGFDLQEYFITFVSNLISRILGAFMRIILIIAGIVLQILVAVVGLAIFLGWLLFPFIMVFAFLFILFF